MDKKIINYTIIECNGHAGLISEVKAYMIMGWQPLGGVGISTYGAERFYQVMVQYEK